MKSTPSFQLEYIIKNIIIIVIMMMAFLLQSIIQHHNYEGVVKYFGVKILLTGRCQHPTF